MSQQRLVRAVVSTACLPKSLAFYGDLLGLDVLSQGPAMAMLDVGLSQLMLHQRPSTPSDAGVALCISVTDLPEQVARWADFGGSVIDPPSRQPWGEMMAVVRDPDGHVVCLVQADE